MLVVKAEIWPGGDASRAIVIGSITAANISELALVSTYDVEIYQRGDSASGADDWTTAFHLVGHHRNRGVWALVKSIIERAAKSAPK